MDRCHLYLPLIDASGVTYPYAEVTLLSPEHGGPIEEPVYLQPQGGAPQTWPVLINPAIVDLWTDHPMRVTVQAALPGGASYTRAGVDIAPAPAATVRTHRPLRIGPADDLDGSALLAVSPGGTANWQVLDALRFHRHGGDAPHSTRLGSGRHDLYPGQTWAGPDTGGPDALAGSTLLGRQAASTGSAVTALGPASAEDEGVAAGSGGASGVRGTALAAGSSAPSQGQVAIGNAATTAAAPAAAVAVGPAAAPTNEETLVIHGAVKVLDDGSITIGYGDLPDLSWLQAEAFTALLGSTVAARYLGVLYDAVVAGSGSPVGFFGASGTTQPLLDFSGVSEATPGHEALLSLATALDSLGLIYRIDGVLDDELADWSLSYAHDPDLVLEVGDASKAGDLDLIKRNAAGPHSVTYLGDGDTDLQDFRLRCFAYGADDPDFDLTAEVIVSASVEGSTWVPVPIAWTSFTATSDGWWETWISAAHSIPAGMRYLRITLDANPAIWAPQIGRVIARWFNG